MYELHNLSALRCFIQDNLEPGEEFLCTLNGDFLSPSLLSSLDLGAAAVSAMNAVPVTHACLGNHEFDHSIEVLGQRLAELDCDVVNTNVFACPPGRGGRVRRRRIRGARVRDVRPSPRTLHGRSENRRGGGGARMGRRTTGRRMEEDGEEEATGAFLDRLPRSRVVTVGNVTVGLVGVCTTSTPLSSARKPRGVVFAEAVPVAREHARRVAPLCDAVVALTHQTLPEDARLAEEVPEIAVILGGHEHTPFAGRMGHGANAAASVGPIVGHGMRQRSRRDAVRQGGHGRGERRRRGGGGAWRGPELDDRRGQGRGVHRGGGGGGGVGGCGSKRLRRSAAGKNRDDFGEGGLWRNNVVADPGSAPAERTTTTTTTDDRPTSPDPTPSPTNVALNHGHAHDLHVASASVAPGAEIGTEVTVRRPGSGVVVSARMYSLRGYRTDPGIDADIWRRSEVLRGLNQHTLSLHEHAARLGFDAVIVQGRARRAVLARHPLRHHPPGRVPRGRVPVQQRRHPG